MVRKRKATDTERKRGILTGNRPAKKSRDCNCFDGNKLSSFPSLQRAQFKASCFRQSSNSAVGDDKKKRQRKDINFVGYTYKKEVEEQK